MSNKYDPILGEYREDDADGAGGIWGQISGTLSAQTDLQAALDAKAATVHTHTLSQITNAGDLAALDDLSTFDTGDLAEGLNLYYTQARFNTAFAAKSTTDLSEGTNLYFTNARAVSAMSGLYEVPLTFGDGLTRTGNDVDLDTTLTGLVSVSSTTFIGALTGNASTATALATGRTIAITGDLSYTSGSFDGTGNVTGTGTLATVNADVGSFGSSTSIPTFTVNGKGLITAASGNAVIAPAGTLTGTTLASNVVTSSLTTIGTLVGGAVPASLVTAGTFGTGNYAVNGDLSIASTSSIQLLVEQTSDNTVNPSMIFRKTRGATKTAQDGDFIGTFGAKFWDDAATPVETTGGLIYAVVDDASNGTEDASWHFTNIVAGASDEILTLKGGFVGIQNTAPGVALDITGQTRISTLTSGRIPYATTAGLLTDGTGLTYNGTTFASGIMSVTATGSVFALNPADTASNILFLTNYYPTTTVTSTTNSWLYDANVTKHVASGVTDSGRIVGMRFSVMRNYNAAVDDSGTLASLQGMIFQYGNFNRDATATPTITNAIGMQIALSSFTGTITSATSLSIPGNSAAGTVTTHYGINIGALVGTTTRGLAMAVASAANAHNLYISGTADNYLEGLTGIGTTTMTGKLNVDQSSTTAAIPVLVLDQADVSEEMIEFVTTIGTGNAIEAVGAKTLTTTHFIKVTLPGGLTRYIPCGTIA